MRERLLVHQPEDPWPEDPWEVRERLLCVPVRGPVGGERTAFSMLPRRFRDSRRLEALLKGRKREDRACSTLLHRLILRVPKATLDILGAYAEDLFRAIFGLELDCGKLWRRKSFGTGVYQPEDPWEVRERLFR